VCFLWVPVSIVLCTIMYFTTTSQDLPRYRAIFYPVALVMAVVWIYNIANILMDMLGLISFLSGINQVILGATLIAWGNSLGDLFANVALAGSDYALMAVTGCFGG
jgi:solute carrier family 24 (sodium/potassium/calcium exchanger), member 6